MIGDGYAARVVRSEEFEGDHRWNYSGAAYPYNTLYFPLSGDASVRVGGQSAPLLPGYVYLIPSNTPFDCACASRVHKFYVDVFLEALPGLDAFSEYGELLVRPHPLESTRALIHLSGGGLSDRLRFHGELEKVLADFIDESKDPLSPEMLPLKSILGDIAGNLSAQLRLKDIAKRHGWHPATLTRAFRAAFHMGLKQYVDRLLMSRLKQALILEDRTLRELAEQYQFCDAYYLSAFFKKREGISPSDYRKLLRRP